MAQVEISRMHRAILARKGAEGWTRGVLDALWGASMTAFKSMELPGDGWKADGDAWLMRMHGYREELDSGGLPVRGFIENFAGSGHHVPDVLMPWALANMADAEEEAHQIAWDGFLRDVQAGVDRLVVSPVTSVARGVAATGAWMPVIVGVAASVAAGILVWIMTHNRPQAVRVVDG
jgi:hypothetical protein